MQLNVQTFNLRHFGHCGPTQLVAEASDLRFFGAQRLYDDACDVGIAIRNEATGNVTRWVLADVEQAEGETTAWVFHPTTETAKEHPLLAGWKAVVLND